MCCGGILLVDIVVAGIVVELLCFLLYEAGSSLVIVGLIDVNAYVIGRFFSVLLVHNS